MRLLLDESLPRRLRDHLSGHAIKTVADMGWSGYRNGRLLAAASAQFDALITADKNMPYQQNPATLPLAVIILDAPSNELSRLLPLVPRLEAILAKLPVRQFARVTP
jgi:predicted nuclease of predicted toxin-antitoxin system